MVPLIVLVNEHRCYLASAGAAIALAPCLGRMLEQRRLLTVVSVAAWVAVAIALTVDRGNAWKDEVALWRDAAEKGPLMVKPHLRLADALERAGEVAGSERSYRRAIELRPAHVGSRNNLGLLLMRTGRISEAEEQFRTVLFHSPDSVPARLNLASLLLRQGKWQLARREYERALLHGDTGGVAQGRLGYIALQHQADPSAALERYNIGLAVAGAEDRDKLLVGKGAAQRALGQYSAAEHSYRQALELDGASVEAWFNLGNVLRDLERPTDAARAFRQVVEIDPNGTLALRAKRQIDDMADE